jgi:hypothetical protein
MRKFNSLALILAVGVAGPALADSTPRAKQDDKDKVVCHREVPVGSIFSRKICTTKGQSDAFQSEEERLKRERMQSNIDRRNEE